VEVRQSALVLPVSIGGQRLVPVLGGLEVGVGGLVEPIGGMGGGGVIVYTHTHTHTHTHVDTHTHIHTHVPHGVCVLLGHPRGVDVEGLTPHGVAHVSAVI
jgi:hypothetical protein